MDGAMPKNSMRARQIAVKTKKEIQYYNDLGMTEKSTP